VWKENLYLNLTSLLFSMKELDLMLSLECVIESGLTYHAWRPLVSTVHDEFAECAFHRVR
jgi:hypothetical protein